MNTNEVMQDAARIQQKIDELKHTDPKSPELPRLREELRLRNIAVGEIASGKFRQVFFYPGDGKKDDGSG